MARQTGAEFFGKFESEHDYSRELYGDDKRAKILNDLGFRQDMVGNRRSLFTSSDIVDQLANASDDHSFKQLLNDTEWGTVLHRGGDTSVGGYQEGKNAFQIRF